MELGDTRLITDTCKRFDLLRNQAAYVLATAYWESARTMEPVEEAFWIKNADAWRKKNLRYYPWHGRGYVQLTWEGNYDRAGRELNRDLTTDPAVVMEPEIAAEILVKGSLQGWFTGKKLGDYITLQNSNFRGARRIINGTDKASAIAEIARDYDAALKADGYGVEHDAPVIEDKRDGTPPRESVTESKTVLAQAGQSIAAAGAVGTGIWNASSENVQIILAVAGVALLITGIIVFRERLKHWAAGVR